MKKQTQGNLLLLLTAFIWGLAFVAQSAGMEYVGPFTFNMARSFVGGITLLIVIFILRQKNHHGNHRNPSSNLLPKIDSKETIIGGICCGVALGVASAFQQVGVSMTTAGKAGFLTALYIVIVPILGLFFKKKTPKMIWLCVVLALIGFYLLCIKSGFSISTGDLLCLVCALCFSGHILVIDHFTSKNTDTIVMSCIQFFIAGLFSLVLAGIFETMTWSALWDAKITILYAGVLSSGVGYTLQMVAQRHTKPTTASLLMSLESVFAALSGWLLLHEVLNGRELAGCALVFAAVILAQLPEPGTRKAKRSCNLS